MATALGAGSPHLTPWYSEAHTDVAPACESLDVPRFLGVDTPDPNDSLTDEEADLLARIASTLAGNATGLTLPELRLVLSERSDALQRGLAAGIRTRQLRRLGSRNKLRYVLNF